MKKKLDLDLNIVGDHILTYSFSRLSHLNEYPLHNLTCYIEIEQHFDKFKGLSNGLLEMFVFQCKEKQHFKNINIRLYSYNKDEDCNRYINYLKGDSKSKENNTENDIVLSTSSNDIRNVEYEGFWYLDISHNKKIINQILEVKKQNPDKLYMLEFNIEKICNKSEGDVDAYFKDLDRLIKIKAESYYAWPNKIWCNSGFQEVLSNNMNIKESLDLKYSINHLKMALSAYINSGNIDLFDLNASIITRDKYPIKSLNIFLKGVNDKKITITCIKPRFIEYTDSKDNGCGYKYQYLLRLVDTLKEAKDLLEYIKDEKKFISLTVQMVPWKESDGKTPEEIEEIEEMEFQALKLQFEKALKLRNERRKKTDCAIF